MRKDLRTYALFLGLAMAGSGVAYAEGVDVTQVPPNAVAVGKDREAKIQPEPDADATDYQKQVLSDPNISEAARAEALTHGGGNTAVITQSGDDNVSTVTQKGTNNVARHVQTGKSNDIRLQQDGAHNSSYEVQNGNYNHKVIMQNGNQSEQTVIQQVAPATDQGQ